MFRIVPEAPWRVSINTTALSYKRFGLPAEPGRLSKSVFGLDPTLACRASERLFHQTDTPTLWARIFVMSRNDRPSLFELSLLSIDGAIVDWMSLLYREKATFHCYRYGMRSIVRAQFLHNIFHVTLYRVFGN